MPVLPFAPLPSPTAERSRDHDRRHPERETLLLAAAGAAKVLGVDHGVTKALAKASITMAKADLWHARLAVKTLRKDQRQAIAEAGEDRDPQRRSRPPAEQFRAGSEWAAKTTRQLRQGAPSLRV